MTKQEISSGSYGSIGLFDRVSRVIWGMAVLFVALHFSIVGEEAYPLIKMAAAMVVLTGIVGWDPVNAAFRHTIQRLRPARTASAALNGA